MSGGYYFFSEEILVRGEYSQDRYEQKELLLPKVDKADDCYFRSRNHGLQVCKLVYSIYHSIHKRISIYVSK